MSEKPASFTAHRVIRAMTKTVAAHDIGLEGFALVAMVAHQWDAIRYARPVQYHIVTLMNLLYLNSKQSFYRIEGRCIKAGWLHRRAQGTRRPVLYWVAIPEHAREAGDGPTEDGGNGTDDGTNAVTNPGPIPTPKRDRKRDPIIPSPLPSPSPTPGGERREIDLEGVGDKTPENTEIDPEQHFPYLKRLAWFRALKPVLGTKLNAKNWDEWERIVKRHSADAVTAAAESLGPKERWPSEVEEILISLQRRIHEAPESETAREIRMARDLIESVGWERVRDELGMQNIRDRAHLESLLDDNAGARQQAIRAFAAPKLGRAS